MLITPADKAGVIVVGHVRYLAARKLGMDFVPVHIAENLTPAQIRAYRLMDNRSHEETDWDSDLLTLEMVELKALDFGLLDFTGFTPRQIDELLLGGEGGDDQANRCMVPPSDRIAGKVLPVPMKSGRCPLPAGVHGKLGRVSA